MKDMQMFSSIRMLLAFVMIPLLQKELDTFKDTVWNTHRIRQQKDTVLPHGIPEHIYNFPSEYGLEESGRLQKFCFLYFFLYILNIVYYIWRVTKVKVIRVTYQMD